MLTSSRFAPTIVGITGFARSGKDTCAEWFTQHGYTKRAFADALRNLALDIDPIITARAVTLNNTPVLFKETYRTLLYERGYENAKDNEPGFRQFLKDLGNGVRKHVGEDAWVRACLDTAPRYTVVSDVRFVNEAAAVMGWGGPSSLVIRVTRPNCDAESEFEAQVPEIPVFAEVANDGTIDDLHTKLLTVVSDYMLAASSSLDDWKAKSAERRGKHAQWRA